jgi:hypothetical protein
METVSRIILDQQSSEALTAIGESAFIVIGKASHPSDPGRWVIHLVPVPMATAAAACEVATGTRKPGKRINTPATAPDASTLTLEAATTRTAT